MAILEYKPLLRYTACVLLTCLIVSTGCENTEKRSPVGPPVAGYWAGEYINPSGSQPITAYIEHDGETVVLHTSLQGEGRLLVGEIGPDGYMLLVDTSNGNTWTSIENATRSSIQIHDWMGDPEAHIEQAIYLTR